jgi:transposase InsO family protein
VTDALNEQGIVYGKNRIARIMRDNGIRAKIRRRFKRTTDSRHGYPVAPNLLIDNKKIEGVWAFDITFIRTREGWLYLSAIMNIRSRKTIGLSMKNEFTQELTTDALRQAAAYQKPDKGLVHQSNRGSQYATYTY